MRKKIKENYMRMITMFVLALLCFTIFWGGQHSAPIVYADTIVENVELDKTNVMDDLKSSTKDGVLFNISDYAFDERKETSVYMFAEYCYSFYSNLRGNYGLYVYVHNPKGLKFNLSSSLNTITLRAGADDSAAYIKYGLLFLNQCEIQNYEGLFLKFKVNLSSEQKAAIFDTLASDKRVYSVGEIELLTKGATNATSVTVSTDYTFEGYAKGYGADNKAESTLVCKEEQSDVLEDLKVHPTYYRPAAPNGKDLYTQDSLHSVYFAIPNDFIKTFGNLYALHATWLDALTKPMLVTGNETVFETLSSFLGKEIDNHTENLDYAYLGRHKTGSEAGTSGNYHSGGYCYNLPNAWSSNYVSCDKRLTALYWLFFAGAGTDSADNFIVPSETIKAKLATLSEQFGGELVNDKYSRSLFENVATSFTEVNITSDDTFNLASATISKDFWDKLFGLDGEVTSITYDGVQAIQPIADSDITGNTAEDCKNLYISSADYTDFVQFYNDNKDDSTVFLFRYQITDYRSEEATLFQKGALSMWTEKDTNAYFFQETINLDFDVIDVTFSNGEKTTVIPVAMSPVDIISDGTPPLDTNSDKGRDWWKILLAVLALIVLLVILMPILPYIVQVILWIILLPFKLIAAIVKAFKKKPKDTGQKKKK